MKVTLTRVLETAKILSTKVGQEIPDYFNYMAEFVEQVVRSLRNGLTFRDNFDCDIKLVSLLHNTPQVIASVRPVTGIIPLRVVSQTRMLRDFGWYYDENNRLTVEVAFDTDPNSSLDVILLLLF